MRSSSFIASIPAFIAFPPPQGLSIISVQDQIFSSVDPCKCLQLAVESGIQVEALGHRDQETEYKEKALEKLSSLHSPPTRQSHPAANASRQSDQTEQTQTRMPAQQSQPSSSRLNADPQSSSPRGTAALAQDSLISEKQQHPASQAAEIIENHELHHRQGSIQMADEIAPPVTDAAPPHRDSQDGSAAYLASTMEAVDILLRSASQQTAVLGLSTLLTILKVKHSQQDTHPLLLCTCVCLTSLQTYFSIEYPARNSARMQNFTEREQIVTGAYEGSFCDPKKHIRLSISSFNAECFGEPWRPQVPQNKSPKPHILPEGGATARLS